MKERLKEFMDENELNAKQLALKIDVQPSSVSHILTGRNKPSIEFLEKLISVFPNIDLKYLITGQKNLENKSDGRSSLNEDDSSVGLGDDAILESRLVSERIMIFYKDGTYAEFLPR